MCQAKKKKCGVRVCLRSRSYSLHIVHTETQLDESNLNIKPFLFPRNIFNLSDNQPDITGELSSPSGKVILECTVKLTKNIRITSPHDLFSHLIRLPSKLHSVSLFLLFFPAKVSQRKINFSRFFEGIRLNYSEHFD